MLATLWVAALVCARLSAYGIWDPWELAVADAARSLAETGHATDPARTLMLRLIGAGFGAFSTREWAGRLPIALSGAAVLAVCFVWVRRFAGTRVGALTVLCLGTTPLFLLHSRQMLGQSPAFLAGAGVMLGASFASLGPGEGRQDDARRWMWLCVAGASAITAMHAGGALLTIVPALGAVALTWLWLHGPVRGPSSMQRIAGVLCVAGAAVVTALVARDVWRHEAGPSLWIGGAPLDDAPPTFEKVIEHVFHGFAPWSALLPVALGSMLRLEDPLAPKSALKLCVVLWATLAYAAQTLFLSAYGSAAYPAPMALAVAAALWLDEAETSGRSLWPETVISVLLVGLLIRDFALYPESPIGILELDKLKIPDTFNPKREWAALLGAFAAGMLLFALATRVRGRLDLAAPYRGLRTRWRVSIADRVWLCTGALAALAMVGFGIAAGVAADTLRMPSIARRVGLVVGVLPLATPVVIAIAQLIYHYSARLWPVRTVPVFAAALALGGYTSQWFLPQLSRQFSPRGVFDAYNKLAQQGEPLGQHHVEGRAAAYYTQGKVRELTGRTELVDFLSGPGRRWAAFPADDLADIDVAYRKRTQRHLFVASETSTRVTLAASVPVVGATDYNPLTAFVLRKAPKVQVPVAGRFEDRIELVGYDLKLPGKDHVGAGQTFVITWFWRVLKGNLGSYKIFLHMDGQDQRLNGDHEPVDGRYPVRLWESGDVIVDRQELSVPATYPSGTYTLYVGFYRGESRLKVDQGPKDDANRLRAGTIRIR